MIAYEGTRAAPLGNAFNELREPRRVSDRPQDVLDAQTLTPHGSQAGCPGLRCQTASRWHATPNLA